MHAILGQGSVSDKCSSSDVTAEVMAIQVSNSVSSATRGCCCKNFVLPSVSSFCAWRGCCTVVRAVFYAEHPIAVLKLIPKKE